LRDPPPPASSAQPKVIDLESLRHDLVNGIDSFNLFKKHEPIPSSHVDRVVDALVGCARMDGKHADEAIELLRKFGPPFPSPAKPQA